MSAQNQDGAASRDLLQLPGALPPGHAAPSLLSPTSGYCWEEGLAVNSSLTGLKHPGRPSPCLGPDWEGNSLRPQMQGRGLLLGGPGLGGAGSGKGLGIVSSSWREMDGTWDCHFPGNNGKLAGCWRLSHIMGCVVSGWDWGWADAVGTRVLGSRQLRVRAL